jgi:thymidine kinase
MSKTPEQPKIPKKAKKTKDPIFGEPGKPGRIEVITGGMFSGKTEELIRRLIRAKIAKQNVLAFKANLDDRYDTLEIRSHSGMSLKSIPVPITKRGIQQIKEVVEEYEKKHGMVDVIGIDEIHFFDDSIVDLVDELADQGKKIIAAGLDLDFSDEPFEPMKRLLAKAEYVDKLRAVCVVCGEDGTKTQLRGGVVPDAKKVIIGGAELYEARCRRCFEKAKVERLE